MPVCLSIYLAAVVLIFLSKTPVFVKSAEIAMELAPTFAKDK
jgi:hypothetical protein